jgi:excisionase family DNA binding protein
MSTRILTVPELSKHLRVHPTGVYGMLKRRQIPAFRIGSDWRFTVEAIDEWLAGKNGSGALVGPPGEERKR